ncbi:MAG: tRNA (adenosine(37)-N6)-threonylcarbamoyltransferase complex dimerization subunit type 1 TsaB [Balneolaceae bacterium]|nr:tRNA (adenosine(37)-N6)-threonylcarbamoyltransferase complex dimerization subunit type 1 TsaB [Balneolaceae bacterium]
MNTVKPLILAIETSTRVCSVALRSRGGEVSEVRSEERGMHAEHLFNFIDRILKEQQAAADELDALLVSRGPGSYTGLRIGASAVKGLLFGRETPLWSVSTLASFAYTAFETREQLERIHAVIDARRKHLYHQLFQVSGDQLVEASEIAARPIGEIQKELKPGEGLIGTGLKRIEESARAQLETFDYTHITARSQIRLFETHRNTPFITREDPAGYDPRYYSEEQY